MRNLPSENFSQSCVDPFDTILKMSEQEEKERKKRIEEFKSKQDKGPLIWVRLLDEDDEFCIAVSQNDGPMDCGEYYQISKDCPVGKEILGNLDKLAPGFTLANGSKVIDVDLAFCPA